MQLNSILLPMHLINFRLSFYYFLHIFVPLLVECILSPLLKPAPIDIPNFPSSSYYTLLPIS